MNQKKDTEKKFVPDGEKFKHLDFLHHEIQRLQKVDTFFSQKVTALQAHPQTDILIEKQKEELFIIKRDLLKRLTNKQSPVQRGLALIWKKAFSKI